MTDDVNKILAERGKTHGKFSDNGEITCQLRVVMHGAPGWVGLNYAQRLALDEIALKIARILSAGSDPNNPDSFKDIAGYAMLCVEACRTNN